MPGSSYKHGLPSVYDRDFPRAEFEAELQRVEHATEMDRIWAHQAGLGTYANDFEILKASRDGRLVRVAEGAGFVSIMRLTNWEVTRANPGHRWHYSPPFLAPKAASAVEFIGSQWQKEMGSGRALSLTSMVRSDKYQARLRKQDRKLTIQGSQKISGHQTGYAFDIDACGLVEFDDDGSPRQINPRSGMFDRRLVSETRQIVDDILGKLQSEGAVNYVEELPGTQENCFHVFVNPNL